MARITDFPSGPQGREPTDQGRRTVSDPRHREQARGLPAELRGRPTRSTLTR